MEKGQFIVVLGMQKFRMFKIVPNTFVIVIEMLSQFAHGYYLIIYQSNSL